MRLAFPRIEDTFDAQTLREMVRVLEIAFSRLQEDQRRGAITVSANYTLVKEDSLVLVSPVASGTVTITVPEVAQWMIFQKWEWHVKLIAAGTLNLTPTVSTIDGSASVSTTTVNTSYTIRATADGWKIL